MIALYLQQQQQPQGPSGLSDLELAQRLQQEEYQQQQAGQPVAARAPSPQVSLLLPVPSSHVPPCFSGSPIIVIPAGGLFKDSLGAFLPVPLPQVPS